MPFASADQAPDLQNPGGIAAFIKELELVAQEMWTRYEVRLGAIFMDTVAACFQMKDENDNAEASRVCRMMRQIADSVGAVIVPVHHYGKDPNTGLRGASAWRAAADVVLSVTCDVDALSGRATNHCLAISKARDAEQGPIAPFILEQVRLAIDEDGEPLNTCVVRYNPRGWCDVRGPTCRRAFAPWTTRAGSRLESALRTFNCERAMGPFEPSDWSVSNMSS